MSEGVRITWYGHACFKIEYGGHSLALDPYRDVPGYPKLQMKAGAVMASHMQHDDHGYLEAVTVTEEEGPSPFRTETVACFHDDAQGSLRGKNNITIIEAGGKRIAHLGDLGHMLSEEQIEAVGKCDVMMIPVGGYYTIDAKGAKQVVDETDPTVVIPMHYRTGSYGFDVIAEPEEFLTLCSDRKIVRAEGPVFETDGSGEKRVVLLRFEG